VLVEGLQHRAAAQLTGIPAPSPGVAPSPAALCVHMCIGMAYGFSVFWLPLTRAVGITQPVPCPPSLGLLGRLTTTISDWDKPLLGWIYTLFFVFLGSNAALFGTWLERAGPRKTA